NRNDPPPKVGALLIKNGQVLAEAYRGQQKAGDHAEFYLLEGLLPGRDVSDAIVYTTLEPCSRRHSSEKIPCARRLVDRRVAEVVIGMYDPNPKIYREGWKILSEAGVRLRDFPADLREEIRADNRVFVDQYQRSEE